MPTLVQASPFFDYAFNSLANHALFDGSINLLCDLIHETQELGENLPVIQAIVPRLVALRPQLTNAVENEDSDTVRGYCRLFVEAGETYAQLMLQHPAEFIPIVEAILQCSAFDDLEVVTISLNFWWRLAVGLRKGGFLEDEGCRPFLEIVSRLVEVVIKHLRWPENIGTFTGQDRDDFRQFRHEVGDTLKDCCSVLGATTCLERSFSIIESEVAKGSSAEWQAIEAALFSIRTMGASVDSNESEVMPRMFAAIPQLPQAESKVRYSATLVVGRYTEWLAVHPDLIPSMLEYILGGFQINQDEVAVASASALKYLCQDCKMVGGEHPYGSNTLDSPHPCSTWCHICSLFLNSLSNMGRKCTATICSIYVPVTLTSSLLCHQMKQLLLSKCSLLLCLVARRPWRPAPTAPLASKNWTLLAVSASPEPLLADVTLKLPFRCVGTAQLLSPRQSASCRPPTCAMWQHRFRSMDNTLGSDPEFR